MTKRILSAMMAFTMLFATSCQNDVESFGTSADGTSVVTFSVETPELATRAFSDGTTATVLQYAVYDEEGNELPALTKSIENANAETINISTNVELKLTTGNTYSVIFWAAAEGAPYTVDFANKKMTVDYTSAACNDENRDAFYARHTFTVNGKQTETVNLYRPFAQLNIGTNDYQASTDAGYTPVKSSVKVKNVYSTLDLFDGTVDGSTEAYYKYTAIPTTETFPVNGYEYLSMNYLLVASEKELVEVEFGYTETDATAEKTRIVGSVPVQRNYRTNIFGQLLTSDVNINVEIVPAYNEPDYAADALYLAAAVGGEVTLTENVTLTSPLVFRHSAIINLNGCTITGGVDYVDGVTTAADITAITVDNGCELTVNGQGAVYGAEYAFNVVSGSTLNIKGDVTVHGATTAVQVRVGTLNIEGGTYSVTEDPRYVINCINEEYWAGNCNMNITGGTYVNFDPAHNYAEKYLYSFCGDGYTTIKDGDNYIVVSGTTVTNEEELKEACANSDVETVVFGENIDISDAAAPYVHISREVKINTNGYTFEVGNAANYSVFCNAGSNVTFEKADIVANGGALVARDGAQVVFEDGSIKIESTSTSHRHMVYAYGEGTTVVINDGNFSFEAYRKRTYGYVASGAKMIINGGTFGAAPNHPNGANAPFMVDGGEIIIKGGTFGFDPSAWVAEGFVATQNGSTWTVSAE